MALSSAPRAIYLDLELKAGIRTDQNTAPTSFSDPQNFTLGEITAPVQESEKLISNMTGTRGAALASVPKTTDPAKLKLEFDTMTPTFLALVLGADVSEVTQSSEAVAVDTVTTALNLWVPLANKYLTAHGTGTEITLKTSANVDVDASKYEVDLVNGMIKATHSDAVGVGMKVGYTKSARTWEQYLAGLAKSAYVQLSGTATERVSGKSGRIDIWCASLATAGAVDPVKGGFFKGALEGDLIMPTGKTSPWVWEMVTA
jgi:hypothetical protein